jgi:hypothetical protein
MNSFLPIQYLPKSGAAVFFSKGSDSSGATGTNMQPDTVIKQVEEKLAIARWGEDNRFPQNISNEMDWCGIGKSSLNWKSKAIYGGGIVPAKVVDMDAKTGEYIYEPLDRVKYKVVYDFLERSTMPMYWAECLLDWVWFANTFEEIVFSKDCKTITNIVHQESADCRFGQMKNGKITDVFLSKLWGASADQMIRFNKNRGRKSNVTMQGVISENVKRLDCIDMYNPLETSKEIAQKLKGSKGLKSAILPINYPSINKTYYQLAAWDGARMAGWIEIASKVPDLLKELFNQNFNIKYHIQVPETYFKNLYGIEEWASFTAEEQMKKRHELAERMDDYLGGNENAYKSFISTFDVDPVQGNEYGLVKIDEIKNKISVDKEVLLSSASDIQILVAMQVHPTLFGAGTLGTGTQRTGGSDIREAFLVQNAMLALERKILVSPLNLVRDYNREVGGVTEWESDIRFFFKDTVLTTLDTGAGTKKIVS